MSLIEAISLTRRFGDVVAVDDVSFQVREGEVVGLLGANGAGKTTTMRMLLGLIAPSSGSARIGGRSVLEVDRRVMGYVPQGLGLYPELSVIENLEFVAAAFGVEMPSLDAEGLADVANRRVGELPLGELPLGVRRRVAFAAARAHHPRVLILDEPTSGVGPLGRVRLWDMIHATAEAGAGILVSTHHMDEAEECDRVILMAFGRVVAAGSVSDIVGSATSVQIEGRVSTELADSIRRAGGNLLVDRAAWRVVGLGIDQVSPMVDTEARARVVPATFEETFVSWSS